MADNQRRFPTPADRRIELEVTRDDVVHLWVERNVSATDDCICVLERLLRRRPGRRGEGRGYRFLGACRDRRAGVDCLCMSFCLVDGRRAGSAAGPASGR